MKPPHELRPKLPITLHDLSRDICAPPAGADAAIAGAIEITGLTADSRAVVPGNLFVALAGAKTDGARFVADALARGAVAIAAADGVAIEAPAGIPILRSREPRRALALMASRFYGPGPETIVAVTGTSGKTSVAEFTRQIFAHLGHKAASLGTLGLIKPDGAVYGALTTPDPVTLARTLADLRAEGITHLAMEASSHGLDQYRIDAVRAGREVRSLTPEEYRQAMTPGGGTPVGTLELQSMPIAAAAFTNLGRDHMDYHPSVEHYLGAKLRLFRELIAEGEHGAAVINMDGAYAQAALDAAHARRQEVVTVGRNGETIRLLDVKREGFKQRLTLRTSKGEREVLLPLVGAYQVENALVAAGLAHLFEGIDPVLEALAHLKGVPGRLEIVGEHDGGLCVVDYAHKPEALAAALAAVRPFATGKLICVFGCGGDRDTGKRPIMGAIAADKADVVIVTDDNPRTEVPAAIRSAVLAGIKPTSGSGDGAPAREVMVREIGDRAEAIRTAVDLMGPGDVVLVAGKGHETGQIVGDMVLPFSDQAVLAETLQRRRPMSTSTLKGSSESLPQVGPRNPFLWETGELVAAITGAFEIVTDIAGVSGVSIDTRTLQQGDLFVALKDSRDGHAFVEAAFKAGAAAALVARDYVRKPGDGSLIRVPDPLRALESLGRAARARLKATARVIAVTGSAGKTTTKEMLRAGFSTLGKTHASEKSYNNHWGVPLTLARMPADTDFGVFEIGMNHAGEITPLSKMVRPHVAVITTVAAAHLGHFASVEEIADAKAEIFAGLPKFEGRETGYAVIPYDSPFRHRLVRHIVRQTVPEHAKLMARFDTGSAPKDRLGEYLLTSDPRSDRQFLIEASDDRLEEILHDAVLLNVLSFGEHTNAQASVDLRRAKLTPEGSRASVTLAQHDGCTIEVGIPGLHNLLNAVACVEVFFGATAGLELPPIDWSKEAYRGLGGFLEALRTFKLPEPGRGQTQALAQGILLVDESYNANPASMAAALATLALHPREKHAHRIAVLGDMRELGPQADQLHRDLLPAITDAGVDLVFAAGPHMRTLYDTLPKQVCGHWAATAAELREPLLAAVKPGDVVMVKGSLGSRMAPLVEALRSHFSPVG